jgi:phytochrome B
MLERSEFQVGSVINSVVSQVMILLRERGLEIRRDIPEEIKVTSAFGDQCRIQQVLADFLVSMVRCAPTDNGWVEIQVKLTPKRSTDGTETILYLFRSVIMFPF